MIRRRRRPLPHSLVAAGLVMIILAGCASTPRSSASASPTAVRVLDVAHALVGTPYCASGASTECFDCSGFVSYCFAGTGIQLPRTARDMYTSGQAIAKGAIGPGDLVFFRTNGTEVAHVGIMVDDRRFIHASTSRGVMISPLTDSYWAPRYIGARRVLFDR